MECLECMREDNITEARTKKSFALEQRLLELQLWPLQRVTSWTDLSQSEVWLVQSRHTLWYHLTLNQSESKLENVFYWQRINTTMKRVFALARPRVLSWRRCLKQYLVFETIIVQACEPLKPQYALLGAKEALCRQATRKYRIVVNK